MNLLSQLNEIACWTEFYEYKCTRSHIPPKKLQELFDFIEQKKYSQCVTELLEGGTFPPPRKVCISKMHSEKKRIVYIYPEVENYILKLLTFLLQRKYDDLFTEQLYSFRPKTSVRHAMGKLIHTKSIKNMWSYKVDISNYFNSIPVEQLLALLNTTLQDEPETYSFIAKLLLNPFVDDNGVLVKEEKGIMAGTPISTFLANLYLNHMDHFFADSHILYARYSDDIILFAYSEEELRKYIFYLKDFLQNAGLTINPQKEAYSKPGEAWTFLGFIYQNGIVDIAPASIDKLKAKMRRKTRALMRWKNRKHMTGVNAAKAFIRTFNTKLFENPVEHELTWTRWYFPIINTTESLQIIDHYSQSCIRYLATDTRTKSSYNFRYEDMKSIGYRSLVHEYYIHDTNTHSKGEA